MAEFEKVLTREQLQGMVAKKPGSSYQEIMNEATKRGYKIEGLDKYKPQAKEIISKDYNSGIQQKTGEPYQVSNVVGNNVEVRPENINDFESERFMEQLKATPVGGKQQLIMDRFATKNEFIHNSMFGKKKKNVVSEFISELGTEAKENIKYTAGAMTANIPAIGGNILNYTFNDNPLAKAMMDTQYQINKAIYGEEFANSSKSNELANEISMKVKEGGEEMKSELQEVFGIDSDDWRTKGSEMIEELATFFIPGAQISKITKIERMRKIATNFPKLYKTARIALSGILGEEVFEAVSEGSTIWGEDVDILGYKVPKWEIGIAGEVAGEGVIKFGAKAWNSMGGKAVREKLNNVIAEATQGKKQDIEKLKKGLESTDLDGVETYEDLTNRTSERIQILGQKVDEILETKTDNFNPDILYNKESTHTTKGSVKINFVETAIGNLEEVYRKTADIDGMNKIKQIKDKFNGDGLTLSEMNKLSRIYGIEFKSKAFNKKGDALTSVNAKMYENIRSGIKETTRSKLPDDIAKGLDLEMSNVYKLKDSSERLENLAFDLIKRVGKRKLGERLGRLVGGIVDSVTFGAGRGFVNMLVKSNVGNKTYNSITLQQNLSTMIKQFEKLNKKLENGTPIGKVKQFIEDGIDKIAKNFEEVEVVNDFKKSKNKAIDDGKIIDKEIEQAETIQDLEAIIDARKSEKAKIDKEVEMQDYQKFIGKELDSGKELGEITTYTEYLEAKKSGKINKDDSGSSDVDTGDITPEEAIYREQAMKGAKKEYDSIGTGYPASLLKEASNLRGIRNRRKSGAYDLGSGDTRNKSEEYFINEAEQYITAMNEGRPNDMTPDELLNEIWDSGLGISKAEKIKMGIKDFFETKKVFNTSGNKKASIGGVKAKKKRG